MNTPSSSYSSSTAVPAWPQDPADPPLAPEVNQRLRHLFRDSLGKGRIHPLYLPMLRYRQSRVGT